MLAGWVFLADDVVWVCRMESKVVSKRSAVMDGKEDGTAGVLLGGGV